MARSSVSNVSTAFCHNFLGNIPLWYKLLIVVFLVINPVAFSISPFVAGWMLIIEFIFTLAMALSCYPLQPGGLLAIEAVAIGMTTPDHVFHEISGNLEVILLLMFMVAGIHFIRALLLYVFSNVIVGIRSKTLASFIFCFSGAVLSAFLDALTVLAVFISICVGFYTIYHQVVSSSKKARLDDDSDIKPADQEDLKQFKSFLRSLLMHAAVGTALGGVCTIVGEPQNLIIGAKAHWKFVEFFLRMLPVSVPVLIFGLITCVALEKLKWFGYGATMPDNVRNILTKDLEKQAAARTPNEVAKLIIQAVCCLWLIIGLAFHLAAVGIIGLTVIILATAFCGVTSEHKLGQAFTESLPFCSLLCVFFAVISVIADQDLFAPITNFVFSIKDQATQTAVLFWANGLLSAVSDNVFVGTLYIDQTFHALVCNEITRDTFDMLAIAVNAGTNLPSVATPNGQAAFLFLLTSSLAPLIKLSYGRMMWMALPYTIVLCVVSFICVVYVLPDATQYMYDHGIIEHMSMKDTLIVEKNVVENCAAAITK